MHIEWQEVDRVDAPGHGFGVLDNRPGHHKFPANRVLFVVGWHWFHDDTRWRKVMVKVAKSDDVMTHGFIEFVKGVVTTWIEAKAAPPCGEALDGMIEVQPNC